MTFQPESYSDPSLADGAVVERQVVTAQPVVAQATPVVEHVIVEPAVHQSVATSYGRRYAFDSVVVGIVGVALLLMGLVAMARAGFDGSMDQPVVDVAGFTHTATLGVLEAAIGVCLLICAAATWRAGAVFFGVLLGVGAFVGAVQTDSFDRSLALESGLAWLCVVAAALVVVVSLLVPRVITNTTRVESI
jgi:hypothetical protein